MKSITLLSAAALLTLSPLASADRGQRAAGNACADLPPHWMLTQALRDNIAPTSGVGNGGFDLNMWATVVNRDGVVCAVAKSGEDRGDQWPGSRVISAQKANTANAFSLPGLALSTANLWAATQPGGSLFGLQFSNPVDDDVAYGSPNQGGVGAARRYGMANDPLVGQFIGGVNVFGGGLALYNEDGVLVGALGISGDTSCADHNIAWRVRDALALDFVPGGVAQGGASDNIIFDLDDDKNSTSGFGHPVCGGPGDVDGNTDPSDVEDNVAVINAAPLH